MFKIKTKKQAFTLIELLVVIAIIGILSTLAVVALQNARKNARDAKRIADIKQIQTALELYYNDVGEYPAEVTSSITYGSNVYMATYPTAPTPPDGTCTENQNNYTYTSADGSTYTITFCTGAGVGGLSGGTKIASPSGIVTPQCGDAGYTVSDIDGNIYNTVKIGDQCWMKENLKTSKYNDGTAITTGLNNTDWSNNTTGAYAIYPHGSVSGCSDDNCVLNMYGALYNWYAVSTTTNGNKNICPTGWRIPTDTGASTGDLGELVAGLGSNSASKLAGNFDLWTNGNLRNSADFNTTGFMALPAGNRNTNGSFVSLGSNAGFWSSSVNGTNAWNQSLNYSVAGISRYSSNQASGFSVRCLKN
jgi:uncharacterized protein (TIGR02145 family)/prepilin-type N-terminal cleavage/methylation domain-containing protein